jgi:hypothetical protein
MNDSKPAGFDFVCPVCGSVRIVVTQSKPDGACRRRRRRCRACHSTFDTEERVSRIAPGVVCWKCGTWSPAPDYPRPPDRWHRIELTKPNTCYCCRTCWRRRAMLCDQLQQENRERRRRTRAPPHRSVA